MIQPPIHKDKLGQNIEKGDCVAYPLSNSLHIGIIIKLNPKMVRVKDIKKTKWGSSEHNKYSKDFVKITGPAVSMYMLNPI